MLYLFNLRYVGREQIVPYRLGLRLSLCLLKKQELGRVKMHDLCVSVYECVCVCARLCVHELKVFTSSKVVLGRTRTEL